MSSPHASPTPALPTEYLVLACRSGEVRREERAGVPAAFAAARALKAEGFAVSVLPPGTWATPFGKWRAEQKARDARADVARGGSR
jgi:hypothetical protein